MAERMAQRLAERRRRDFVGRERELGLADSLLRARDNGAVLFVSGPGGVGKTTLLEQIGCLAAEAGRRVVRLDGRDLPPIGASVVAEMAARLGVADRADPLAALGELPGLAVLVDTAERLTALDRWFRETLLPGLGADTVTVVAGREAPTVGWRTDPGWRGLVHHVRLDNLSQDDSATLLARRGVPPGQVTQALAFTHGHPLALALVADVLAQGADPIPPPAMPDVLGTLVAALIDTVPSALHRRALDACAQVLTTTEPLLAALLDRSEVTEIFAWLRGLSIVEAGPRGLFPHDVARDVLGAELRWRHPEQYADIHRRAGAFYRERFYAVPSAEQQQVLVDYVFLHRDNPVLGPFVTGSTAAGLDLRSLVAGPAEPADRDLVLEMVGRHEGPESAALADYWLSRQPVSMSLVRGPVGEVLGLVGTLALPEVTAADRSRDPAVDRVCAFLETRPSLGPDETAGFFRFWMQREGYQDLGPVQLFITLHFVRYYLSTSGLAYSFVYYADPDLWADICAYADLARLAGADFTVGDRRYGIYWHDWRRRPPLAWLEVLGEREIARSPLDLGGGPPGDAAGPVLLPDGAFADAVKAALAGLGRADGLRGSPLLGSALVDSRVPPGAGERQRCEVLLSRIREAAARLEASPRDRRGFRALHHTYLQPAPTQAAAAALLDLPTTTYRRHLTAGVARLTEILRQDDLDSRRG